MGRPQCSHRPGPKKAARKRSRRAAASVAQSKRWHTGQEDTENAGLPTARKELFGSRIIDLENLSQDVKRVSEHSATCKGVCQLVQEVRREGLASVLLVQCQKCSDKFFMESSTKVKGSKTKKTRYAVNVGAVLGQMATGGGHSRLNETTAALNIPGMSKKTFISIETQIGKAWETQLAEEIKQAGEHERQVAIDKNDTFEGVPAIGVTVDGGWSKRSHKHSYNAKTGVAVIIGNTSKKLLYLGVRNKYCSICTVAANKGIPPKEHECFKNWDGSSRAMEADMLVEGFKAAEDMQGLRYMRMTGDGDSSVLSNIQASVPGWGSKVTKVECANHVVKCYRSRLEKIVQDFPKYKGRGKLTQKAIKRLATGARCAIKMHSKSGDVEKLRKDLRNGPSHVFNDHTNCSTSFCKVAAGISGTSPPDKDNNNSSTSSQTSDDEVETEHTLTGAIDNIINSELATEREEFTVEDEARGGDSTVNRSDIPDELFFMVQRAGDRLVSNAPALITNATSNLAECFMGIRCKFDGGKVYNRNQRGSFHHRSYGAGLRFQLGPDWAPKVWPQVTGQEPGEVMKAHYDTRAPQHEKTMKRKATQKYKEQRKKARYGDPKDSNKEAKCSYGPQAVQPEVTPTELKRLCSEYKHDLIVSQQDAQRIEEETKQQSEDTTGLWSNLRRCRLTASNFGVICKRRSTTPVTPLVRSLVYKSSALSAPSLRWGRENESNARKAYNKYMQENSHPHLRTIRAGFVIHPHHGWLGCSPDDWVVDPDSATDPNGIAEYKCPYTAREMTPEQACSTIKGFFCKLLPDGTVTLRTNHSYYYQVQGALGVTGRQWCDFVVWTPQGVSTERILFDQNFWESMVPKLECFFDTAVLPELAAPQHPNGRPIREPGEQTQQSLS